MCTRFCLQCVCGRVRDKERKTRRQLHTETHNYSAQDAAGSVKFSEVLHLSFPLPPTPEASPTLCLVSSKTKKSNHEGFVDESRKSVLYFSLAVYLAKFWY